MKVRRSGEVERNRHIRQTHKYISCRQDAELKLRGVRGQQVSVQGNDVGVSADRNVERRGGHGVQANDPRTNRATETCQ